jgi:lipid-A-disaccharide synthase
MKYYLIAGEASGDLHASRLMKALKEQDAEAQFRFYGGDQMQAVGGTLVKHYRELAYMGFIPVLLHLPTILRNMKRCKQDISAWQPDVVILVDYPGFNLSIAKYVKQHPTPQVFYYISPKIWAWKEHRIKNIKRDVDELFSILPFEVEFFEKKHRYPIHYVGNPTADEVREWKDSHPTPSGGGGEGTHSPIIALLAGSRKQEIKDNLPMMIRAAQKIGKNYELVLAGAPSIDDAYYQKFLEGTNVRLVKDQTYALLSQAHAALVTSGTATLETALFGVPQVVCYGTSFARLFGWLRKHLLKVKYVSLVNLVADREVVRELVADTFTEESLQRELEAILDGPARQRMLDGYQEVWQRLGKENAPQNAAKLMIKILKGK